MNNNQIAFIICVNDDFEYSECQYYLSKLKVPDGFSMDVITIQDASSMAEGYNAGMQSSNAKYKVYMHQDTFIINENFIQDILEVFSVDDKVGLIGLVGCRMLPENAVAVSAWDTGKVYHNFGVFCGYQNGKSIEVDTADGLMMVTQYDIPWREDLFTQWDYYDISQCYEFRLAGYKTVVPYQKECWCYHDNKHSQISSYVKCRDVFVREYQDFYSPDTPIGVNVERCTDYDQLNREMKENVALLIDMEQDQNSQIHFYHNNMNHRMLMEHFRALRHYLNRIEYGKVDFDVAAFRQEYSVYATSVMARTYCDNLGKVNVWINETYGIDIDLGEYSYKELTRRQYSISQFMNSSIVFSDSLEDFNLLASYFMTDIKEALLIVNREDGQITDSSLLDRIKEIRFHDVTMVRRMLKDEIYTRGKAIIVCGAKAGNYASLYHNTDIPVKWYIESTLLNPRKYSENICVRQC